MCKYVNKSFFKGNKKPLILILTAVIGVAVFTGGLVVNYDKEDYSNVSFRNPYDPKFTYTYEDYQYYQDKKLKQVLDDNYIGEHPNIATFTIPPSDSYDIKIYKGLSECTHYRFRVSYLDDKFPLEYSEWQEIPADGLVKLYRSEFSEKQYDKCANFYIEFGRYDNKLDKIVCDQYEEEFQGRIFTRIEDQIISFSEPREEVDKYNTVLNKMLDDVMQIIEEDDTDFDKIKKTYDYVIDHMQYFHYHRSNAKLNILSREEHNINSNGKFYADCTNYSYFIERILNSIGVECFCVLDSVNCHIWNMVKVDGKYYHLDATYSDTGSWSNTSKYRYFLVSDQFMLDENRVMIKEKEAYCDEMYDLTDIVSEYNVRYRGLK